MNDLRLWHPWLRINRLLRAMLHKRWSAEAWPQVKVEFKKALALRSQISALGLVQLRRVANAATRTEGLAPRRVLPRHLYCDGLRRVRVGVVVHKWKDERHHESE